MSYTPGTRLVRKTPFEPPRPPRDGEEPQPDNTPYNEIEVIGPSPVQEALRAGEWTGQLGDKISVSPVSFGAVIDLAYGELLRDYDVVSEPDLAPPAPAEPRVTRVRPGPSPEEQFAAGTATPVKPGTPERFEADSREPDPRVDALEAEIAELKGMLEALVEEPV